MNELIKELADRAWRYADDNSRDGDETHGRLYRDKFAELIVKECVDTLRLVPYTTDREFGDEAIYQEAVLKKFGLKL